MKKEIITTKELLRATGLKSARTLVRWARLGIIPKPTVGPSPSGEGRTALWPHRVLERCVEIVRMRKEGHRPVSAAAFMDGGTTNRPIHIPGMNPAIPSANAMVTKIVILRALLTEMLAKSKRTIPIIEREAARMIKGSPGRRRPLGVLQQFKDVIRVVEAEMNQ